MSEFILRVDSLSEWNESVSQNSYAAVQLNSVVQHCLVLVQIVPLTSLLAQNKVFSEVNKCKKFEIATLWFTESVKKKKKNSTNKSDQQIPNWELTHWTELSMN